MPVENKDMREAANDFLIWINNRQRSWMIADSTVARSRIAERQAVGDIRRRWR